MKKTIIAAWGVVILSFITSIYLYPQMPELVASHWGPSGQVDGYMGKFWGLFLMPIVLAVCLLLFVFLPKLDPLKKNFSKFEEHYDGFILMFTFFMAYIYSLTIAWNLNYRFSMTTMIIPAFSVLFYYIGFILDKLKRNWFMGIRNPWTLSSDVVWDKTHKLGAKLFKASAIISLSALFLGNGLILLLAPILVSVVYLMIYSYLEYKKTK